MNGIARPTPPGGGAGHRAVHHPRAQHRLPGRWPDHAAAARVPMHYSLPRTGCGRPRPKSAPGRTAGFDATDPAALGRFFAGLPTPVDHVMVTGPGPYYAPLAELNGEREDRAFDDHQWLAVEVAQLSVGQVRPGGTLLFMGGTAGLSRGPGLSFITAASAPPCLRQRTVVRQRPDRHLRRHQPARHRALFSKLTASTSYEQFSSLVAQAQGSAGLIRFLQLDLDHALTLDPQAQDRAGRRLVRLIAGNPVTMGEMTRHLADAGSYAPSPS